ncbi:MAG: hypothetical protein LBF12_06870 [Christensenellaceae bacterium]|jgi:hypothetical protein|nr:hypothetical protein [Christensenellaceae bacterium]
MKKLSLIFCDKEFDGYKVARLLGVSYNGASIFLRNMVKNELLKNEHENVTKYFISL